MRAFIFAALVFIAFTDAASAGEPFSREAAIKALGYEPETVVAICKSAPTGETNSDPAGYLMASGTAAATRIACPQAQTGALRPFVRQGEMLAAATCSAAAEAAGDKITVRVSEMMASEHPDVVAAYADGVAQALEPIRDACVATKEVWAKVAAQTMLFQNRAVSLRAGRVCALWRLALDKELKAATAAGQSKGRAAGLARFQLQVKAAQDGTHQYCGEDSASSMIDANVDLTKMLLDTMSDK